MADLPLPPGYKWLGKLAADVANRKVMAMETRRLLAQVIGAEVYHNASWKRCTEGQQHTSHAPCCQFSAGGTPKLSAASRTEEPVCQEGHRRRGHHGCS